MLFLGACGCVLLCLSLLIWSLIQEGSDIRQIPWFLFVPMNQRLSLRLLQQRFERRKGLSGQYQSRSFQEFLSLKQSLFLVGVFFTFLLFQLPFWFSVLVGLVLFVLPDLRMEDSIKKRRRDIRIGFIVFLDLLVLLLDSGVDFAGALQFLKGRLPKGPFAHEMENLLVEMRLGTTREAALNRFADRLQDQDIRQFTQTVIQSDKGGGALSGVLKNLALSLRTQRIQKAEKRAHEAPVKLLFPLAVFIFPVVFIVLFGPVVLNFIK
ncbi:MAG: hypothetical protein A2293_07405 [Elusimicrobia bacterium RIFOXYB2_FULL_49_7]|nr:MAG: hypothetical protein A2293_07405 [Elusimicrobia bacterium RIFOXYB2_FULL_49_7]